eukprot:gene10575-13562_t
MDSSAPEAQGLSGMILKVRHAAEQRRNLALVKAVPAACLQQRIGRLLLLASQPIVQALNRSGLFLIESDFPIPSLFFRVDIQRGIDKLADKIARSYDCDAPDRSMRQPI